MIYLKMLSLADGREIYDMLQELRLMITGFTIKSMG